MTWRVECRSGDEGPWMVWPFSRAVDLESDDAHMLAGEIRTTGLRVRIMEEPEPLRKCLECGGMGWYGVAECCGRGTPSGECCGEPEHVQAECVGCLGTGYEGGAE